MKYFLAFALIAVAMALPEPMRLLEPVQLAAPVEPLVVPQEVMDEVALKVKFVDAPETAVAPETTADLAVNFVDEAVNVDAPVVAIAPETAADFTVNFVEEAVNVDAVETAVAPEAAADFAVNFVDEAVNVAPEAAADFAVNFVEEAVNVDAPEAVEVNAVKFVDAPVDDASDYAVNFVDEAINAAPEAINLESPIMSIKITDIPLQDSVVMPLVIPTIDNVQFLDAPVQSNADFAVKFVDVPDVDEETPPSYMPIKLYPNTMWR